MYVPDRIVTNEEISHLVGLSPDHIFKSSGIRQRRWAAKGTRTSQLATAALQNAIKDADIANTDIDYLIMGTMTPDRFIPGTGPTIQHLLGLRQIPCLDIRAACCNTLYGLQLARSLIASGEARNVALCFAEVQSALLQLTPTAGTTTMLFGDGASALVVSNETREKRLRFVDLSLSTDGAHVDLLGVRCPGTEFGSVTSHSPMDHPSDYSARMDGQAVIVHALRKIIEACQNLLKRNGLTIDDVRWIVPHQANANLLKQIARGLRFESADRQVILILEDYGNTSSASMGMSLDVLRRSGQLKSGDYLLLPAFGAGFTWGAALCLSE